MTTVIIVGVISLLVGFILGFVVIAAALASDFKEKTGVWLSYSKKRDKWECFGDMPVVFAKARTHHKAISHHCNR